VEVSPGDLLPHVRRLIESLNVQQIQHLDTRTAGSRWPGRREIVWLADKFLRLPEHFRDAERILLRLALAETEAYANHATGLWKPIFGPFVSATSIAFAERLQLLESRFDTKDKTQIDLCFGGLSEALRSYGPIIGRPLGPPVVAGRIPPLDWQPANEQELKECW